MGNYISMVSKFLGLLIILGFWGFNLPLAESVGCSYWDAEKGITDDDKAWKEILKQLKSIKKGKKNIKFNVPLPKGKIFKAKAGSVIKAWKVVDHVFAGEYEKAGKQMGGALASKLVPVFGQYKAVLDAFELSAKAVIDNWVADLELHDSYKLVATMVQQQVVIGAKKGDPYLPSHWVRGNKALWKKMRKKESLMFSDWEGSEDTNNLLYGTWKKGGWQSRIIQKYGKMLNDKKIFNRFFYSVVKDMRGFIQSNYNRIKEDKVFDEAYDTQPKLIKSVCSAIAEDTPEEEDNDSGDTTGDTSEKWKGNCKQYANGVLAVCSYYETKTDFSNGCKQVKGTLKRNQTCPSGWVGNGYCSYSKADEFTYLYYYDLYKDVADQLPSLCSQSGGGGRWTSK